MAFNTIYLCMHIFIVLLNTRLEYLKTFEWFCFSLKYKVFVEFSKWKMCTHGVVFLILKDFASLRSSFFEYGKILPHLREFDHHFLPRGQGIRQKNLPGWPGFGRSKNFPGVAGGGGGRCTQLELPETKQTSYSQTYCIASTYLLHITKLNLL